MELTAQYQDNKLLNDMLERHYYSEFKKNNSTKEIELFLYGNCSSHCEYCYLKKYENDLFPLSLDTTDENILNHLQLIIRWYKENHFRTNINIFSSDWLLKPVALKIFDMFYQEFKDTNFKPKLISFADNMLFLNNDNITQQIQNYIDLFKEINIDIKISASIDGKLCDNFRTSVSDEFYSKLFTFLNKNHYLIHPMISANNIKYQINNHHWWRENAPEYIVNSLMMLEVRDNNWTDENINDLIIFLDYLVDYYYNIVFKQNKIEFLKFILGLKTNILTDLPTYRNIGLVYNGMFENVDTMPCSFNNSLVIRVADLKLGLCHRLFYPEFEIGEFLIEDNKIFNVKSINTPLEILKYHLKQSNLPHCENCYLNGVCNKFCLGSAYENQLNMLVPPQSVCKMQQSKITFLFYKYENLDLFSVLDQILLPDNVKSYFNWLRQNLINNFKE